MDSYIITKRKEYIYSLIWCVLLYPFFFWLGLGLDRTTRSGRKGAAVIIYMPIYIIILVYDVFRRSRKKSNNETLIVSPKRIVIFGDYKSHVDLEWRKMKKIEIVNGITTKLVFHFKYKTEEVYLYSYQRTFKLIKALKHFGNGIEVTERWKIFKLLYVPFW